MKNALNYYYNLNPNNIYKKDNMYKFEHDNEYYTLLDITNNNKNLNDIYNMTIELNRKGIYTHQIILNSQNSIETYINNNKYVLLKTYGKMDETIKIEDIINFSIITSNLNLSTKIKKDNWYQLWINKMDYFEYQISQFGKKYPLLTESFSYFEGITETGISLLVFEKVEDNSLCISHNRIKTKDTLFDFYNPFNFIIDVKIRDVAEYIKDFLKKEDPSFLIEQYLKNIKLTDTEYKLFFIRLLYPSFYFDTYEDIIDGKIEETEINKIIERINVYKKIIKQTYQYIQSVSTLNEIEWIKKM
ncbi:MAG: hypothetical protein E7157_00925 [Lactobacillales bacterium]|nr:hypothetical protein [Lactobacillales bacterium]